MWPDQCIAPGLRDMDCGNAILCPIGKIRGIESHRAYIAGLVRVAYPLPCRFPSPPPQGNVCGHFVFRCYHDGTNDSFLNIRRQIGMASVCCSRKLLVSASRSTVGSVELANRFPVIPAVPCWANGRGDFFPGVWLMRLPAPAFATAIPPLVRFDPICAAKRALFPSPKPPLLTVSCAAS